MTTPRRPTPSTPASDARAASPGDRGEADRRALDEHASSGPNGQPATCRTLAPSRPTWLPWSVPSRLGVERPEPVGPGELEVAEPAVRIGLEQERVDGPRPPSRDDLAPATALRPSATVQVTVAPSAARPPAGQRGSARSSIRRGARLERSRRPSSSVAAAQRAATASSSPASGRRDPPGRPGPRARRTRARPCRARGPAPGARPRRTAGTRRRRPTATRAAPRSRRGASPSRSRSAPTRRPTRRWPAPASRRRAPRDRAGRPC